MDWLNLITGGGLGAALGTLAGIGEKVLLNKMQVAAKVAEYAHIEKMHALNADQQERLAKQNLILAEVEADVRALTGSYTHDTNEKGQTAEWVNNIRALVRPASIPLVLAYTVYAPEVGAPMFFMILAWYFASRGRATVPS